jgi:hypothetical protein
MARKQRQNTTKAPKVTERAPALTEAPAFTEEELGKVSGGAIDAYLTFTEYKER